MAIKKNKDGIMAAITAATVSPAGLNEPRERAQRSLPRGTIGSVRAGLGGIQEIDTKLILPWGPVDRLDTEFTAVNSDKLPSSIDDLAESISASEQQVPVLLRPAKDHDGRFEVIYGRRRILACKKLGITVKALIRTLDDTAALMAKGLENSSRSDLSFYERARFASDIIKQGYERSTACQALNISKSMLSQLERVTRTIPDTLGDKIGSAPEAGRPKWMSLVAAFESGLLDEVKSFEFLNSLPDNLSSDERLARLINESKTSSHKEKVSQTRTPIDGVQISSSSRKLTVSVKSQGNSKDFAIWLDRNIDHLLNNAFEQFKSENEST
ncbi:plasmid partitioning protein RepB [Lentilitoribacter sp. EG35]|uniref:plasmid partitioning protein RepB n=1 Tax=Lentilitoribacter sp. EG35 TaxID=3234192 RepID=UPI00345F52F5